MKTESLTYHYHQDSPINSTPEEVFAYVDDHTQLSSHMNQSSWMMGGGSMETHIDEGNGQRVGSHIRMSGKAFGLRIALDEVVTDYQSPYRKTWETIGHPRLLIIGHYRMGIEITPRNGIADLRIFIDYDLPRPHAWLGYLFSHAYAKWCVRQMLYGVRDHFK